MRGSELLHEHIEVPIQRAKSWIVIRGVNSNGGGLLHLARALNCAAGALALAHRVGDHQVGRGFLERNSVRLNAFGAGAILCGRLRLLC